MSAKKKPTMREQIAELEAELAGCEATIEELEAKNAALQKRVDEGDFKTICAVRRALRASGVSDSLGPEDGIRYLSGEIELFRAHAAESQRRAETLKEEYREALRDLNDASRERYDWKITAQALAKTVQDNGDLYLELLEKTEAQRVRNVLRKAVARVVEVVR